MRMARRTGELNKATVVAEFCVKRICVWWARPLFGSIGGVRGAWWLAAFEIFVSSDTSMGLEVWIS